MTRFRVAPRFDSWSRLGHAALIAWFVIFACLSSGCNSSGKSGEIVIGHFASMTGSEATFGRSTDNGIQMAIDEINKAGGVNGKQVSVITYDDKGEQREAGNAVTR